MFWLPCNNVFAAIKVKPLLIEIESAGRGANTTINIQNDGANPFPVELSMEKLDLHLDAVPTTKPADDLWLVFPPQAIIPPGGQQNFRLQWLGDPDLQASESFYAVVKQVPVKLPDDHSAIQIVYNIRALVNVAPLQSKSKLLVKQAEVTLDEEKKPIVMLLLENPSKRHAMFSEHELSLELLDDENRVVWSKVLTHNDIYQTLGGGLVQPNKLRRFALTLELPEQANNPQVTVKAIVKPTKN